MDVSVKGADDLERLAKAIKAAGSGDLRKELLRGLREAGKPVLADVKAHAAATLPHSGGLAERMAGSKFAVRNKLSGKSAGIRLTASGGKLIEKMNEGLLRHPVFGNRTAWVSQSIPAGWFSKPIEANLDTFRDGIAGVMDDVAKKIDRGV